MWFSLSRGGFYKFENGNWSHLYPTTPNLVDENSKACFVDSNGNIWIGYDNGHVAIYNEGGIVNIDNKKENELSDIKYFLNQNYPNPFNPSTVINYSIAKSGFVTLKVFDVLGREVAVLVNKEQSKGNYKVNFDVNSASGGLSSGVYYYKLSTSKFSETKKMLLLR